MEKNKPDSKESVEICGIPDLMTFDLMQMEFDPVTMTSRFFQECHLQITQEVIKAALQCASDKQLQVEVKRRADVRRALRGQILRCRDCKHCIQGYASRYAAFRGYKTSVCEMKPKDKAWRGCFYSTMPSRKACEQFKAK